MRSFKLLCGGCVAALREKVGSGNKQASLKKRMRTYMGGMERTGQCDEGATGDGCGKGKAK